MKKVFILLAVLLSSLHSKAVSTYKEQMKHELQFVANTYRTAYAPSEWKYKYIAWDLDNELAEAMGQIDSKQDFTVKDYQKTLKNFFRSTQDYHVGYRFYANERATLPFSVKSAQGKIYIAHINRDKLSLTAFPYNVGDEVVEFDGRPVQDVLNELAIENGMGVARTDQAIAELLLTSRSAAKAMDVPRGTVEIGFKKEGADKPSHIQLIWEYTPETVNYNDVQNLPLRSDEHDKSISSSLTQSTVINKIKDTQMSLLGWDNLITNIENPFAIGNRKSFVPMLGKLVWESDKENHYHAYIYKNDEGKLIGYIRIAHYMADGVQFSQFKEIIEKYQNLTDALVIDEINNPGGSVFYIYALNSVLSDKVMYTPKHHLRIYPQIVADASDTLLKMAEIKNEE
ncbi:MAG: protease-like activity factor CPAF, partial [Bdellovibrionaceae bacterium]|nr:protease-like activity factor CPAF [Pseudobdellovibrionaceae bacterium]